MSDEKIRALSGITLAYVSDGEAGSLTVRYAPTNITSENDMTMEPDQYTKYLGVLKEGGDITIKADYDWALIKGQKGEKGEQGNPGVNGEDAVLLRIESSRGTVFKNDQISTVLSVVIYKGSHRITNSTEMKAVFGNGAYLEWRWLRLDDESYGIISASDPRFGNGGFTFTLSPNDVDTKVTFECKLIL